MVSLENLFLSGCGLEGELPKSFRNLSHLRTLDLRKNKLNGSIPEAFGSMISLEFLYLSECQLEGGLPKSFSNLSRLDTLDLGDNNFNGQLSEFLHPLATNEKNSLRVLNLGSNQLAGSLPDFTRFRSLREFKIFNNKLNGSFPENFAHVSDIVHLDVSSNQITGLFPNLTSFPSLETLLLQNNELEDTILEAYLSTLTRLHSLDLSYNRLTFKFSSDWVPPFRVDSMLLRNCILGPHFPNWLRSQRNISVLDISGVGISDTIPLWFWDLSPGLKLLNISYNQIQGTLPDLSLKFTDSIIIDASSNNLKGLIPSFPSSTTTLDLSKNMFSGSISFLCKTAYTSLLSLDLSDNQLSGELPDCWLNTFQLSYLNLANNNLSGTLATSSGNRYGIGLQILQLRNNRFKGEFPSSLKMCILLRVLDLSENELSGELPTWIDSSFMRLQVFSVRKNQFSGTIPLQVCQLRQAQVLDLSQNRLSGSIPHCLNNLTSLVERISEADGTIEMGYVITNAGFQFSGQPLGSAIVQWKGIPQEYRTILGFLKLIDLSSNKLVGEIPQEFASLEGLKSLNLSRNNLSGNIIQNIGQMTMLETLDLSRNQFSGKVPLSLASLTFLGVLNLSENNFTGKIPSSTQLQSFDPSVYAGNQLCGPPLSSACPGDETNVPPPPPGKEENNDEDEDRFVTIGFYISAVLGFVVGFWGLLGPILLRPTWRHTYFQFLAKINDWIYVTTLVHIARLQKKITGSGPIM